MKISILGLGNVLMGDDGFGPSVIRELESRFRWPVDVEVLDLGTPGLDLIPFLIDRDAVIIVDTVRSTGTPGTLRVYPMDEILRHSPAARMTPHDPGLKTALLSLRMAGLGPSEVTLVGVIPARVMAEPGLSPPVRAAMADAIDAVVSEVKRLGVRVSRHRARRMSPAWWEGPATA